MKPEYLQKVDPSIEHLPSQIKQTIQEILDNKKS